MGGRRTLFIALAAAAVVLLVGRAASGLYADYLWYSALGAREVWEERATNVFLLRGASWILGTAFVFANFYAVRVSVVSLVLPRRVANLDIAEEVPGRALMAAVVVLSILLGGLLALPHGDWTMLTLAFEGELFKESDPYFSADLGFFTYWLPFERAIHLWALITLLAVSTLVVFLYALTPSLRWERGTLRVSGYVRRHLSVLGALLLVLLAWSYRLDAYSLLTHGSGPLGEFTSIDHRPGITVNLFLAIATAAASVLVLWAAWTGQMRIAFGAVTAVLLLSLALRQLAPPLVQRTSAPVDPSRREAAYASIRASYTRRAYGIDGERFGTGAGEVVWPSIREAARGISSWEPLALERSVERVRRQGAVNGSIGWASDSARLVATLVQRPLPQEEGTTIAPDAPWTVTRVRAAATDERGAWVAASARRPDDESTLATPVYVADGTTGYTVVVDREDAVAAPELSSPASRIALAWAQQNFRLAFAEQSQSGAKLLSRRGVRERLTALLPFFAQGSGVYPIADADSLYWAVHLYSTSASYPLSDRISLRGEEVRYLHHAGVAIVHAYTGRVFVVADAILDPIARTWVRRFPSLFVTAGSVRPSLASAIPPPVDVALAMASAFARVGLRGELPLGSRVPRTFGGDTLFAAHAAPPFAAPGTGSTAWSVPVLDGADRVRGLVSVAGGPQPVVRWLPLPRNGPRWGTVIERLQRVADSTTPPPRDGRLLRGRVRVVPLESGPAYVQTTYAMRADGLPLVARVAALVGDSTVSGRSIAEAVGAADTLPQSRGPITPAEFAEQVRLIYGQMREALRRGDLTAYAAAFEELGRLVEANP